MSFRFIIFILSDSDYQNLSVEDKDFRQFEQSSNGVQHRTFHIEFRFFFFFFLFFFIQNMSE